MARSVDDRMSFMEHLGELRVRIVRALTALLVGSVPGLYFSQQIVDWLARPVTKLNYSLVFTSPAEALWVQMKVGLIVGIFVAAPGILWQVWAFIAPGLHEHEKKYALPFVLIGSLLFIGGGVFSLFVVTPYALEFLLSYARPGLQPMITLQNLTDFLLKFTLAFGAVFELPLALTILARLGVVNAKMLARNRKYAILGAFIAGAVLTPTPDAFNQTLMAGPLFLLYEVGIICARIFCRKPKPVPVAEETPAWRDGLCHAEPPRAGHAGHSRRWLRRRYADPGGDLAAGPQGQGRRRPVADRDRQDRRVPDRRVHAPAPHAGAPRTRWRGGAARARHRAHARAGRADRGRRPPARPLHAV